MDAQKYGIPNAETAGRILLRLFGSQFTSNDLAACLC